MQSDICVSRLGRISAARWSRCESLNNTFEHFFESMRAHSRVVRGKRALSRLSPGCRYLLPRAMTRSRDTSGGPVRLVHSELSYARQDLNGELTNDAVHLVDRRTVCCAVLVLMDENRHFKSIQDIDLYFTYRNFTYISYIRKTVFFL